MQPSNNSVPIPTIHLFPVLNDMLIELLSSLTDEAWQLPTVAKQWNVKDIAAHLLDGNLRGLSVGRDTYFSEPPTDIQSYKDLVAYLNNLNHTWVQAAKRLSPAVLIELLTVSNKQYAAYLQSLKPFDKAIFSVAWAGEATSYNWFHIAREYTEKFIHQQQIREAVGKQALFTKELFYPFIATFMQALPFTYQKVPAAEGTTVTVNMLTDIGGQWTIIKTANAWIFTEPVSEATAIVQIHPDIAWKLFSKSLPPEEAMDKVTITGDKNIGVIALQMVSVMA